jgi:hypothetical protein
MTTTGIVLTENRHAGGFMVSEAPGRFSRDDVTLAQNQNVVAGQVLGEALKGSGSFSPGSASAQSGNTGNGTVGTVTAGVGVQAGTYRLQAIAATHFEVFDPSGRLIGEANTGTAFVGQIGFTITAGGTAFVSGDAFTVAVTETDPSDAGEFVALGVSTAVTSAATSSGSTLTFAAVPSSVIAGMVVADLTTSGVIPAGTTVSSVTATTVVLSANVTSGGVLSGDTITFTAADGSQNAAAISWGNYSTGSGVTMPITVIDREAEVRGVDLTYPAGASAAQIAVINAQLLAIGIVVR